MPKKDEALLQEIRDRFTYAMKAWKPIIDESRIDMKYISGDPWASADKEARKKAGRPALQMDELNQYTNQYINNLRQNPRGIKVNPAGNKATDQTAELHQDMIRGIEYRSNAQRNAYIPAAENAVNRSYGFIIVKRQYLTGKTFDQEIVIEGCPNPESILFDPDCRKPDWSDAMYCFEISVLTKDEFKRKYPKAEIKDFTPDDIKVAPGWFEDNHVTTAGYWKVDIATRKLLQFDTPEGPQIFYDDEIPETISRVMKPTRSRVCEERQVKKYITNGIEILERHEDEPGEIIPVVPVLGKELWVEGERVLMSMVRLARDPQMYYCYLCSQEAEEAKMTPKVPVIGYVGQFETDKDTWDTLTEIPHTRAQVDPIVDGANGEVLPLPTRPQFVPNFQAYEMAKDGARRAIQAAMGINPLPTAAQRRNEKSGVALEKIESQESIGSFHFTDNLERSLALVGKIIEQYIPVVNDTEREVPVGKADGTQSIIKINTPQPYMDASGQQRHYPIVDNDGNPYGEHNITITTAPSYDSQREAAAAFGDTIIQNIEQLPLDPAVKAKFMSLLIRMRNLGPLGDEMADLLDPQQGSAEQNAQQAMAKVQQQQQILGEMQAELQKLQFEKAAKMVDNATKLEIEKMRQETSVLIAEVSTKAQDMQQRLELFMDMVKQWHDQAHDSAMSAQEHGQDMQTADQQHQQALQQGDQAAQNQVAVAQATPGSSAGPA